MTYRVITVDEIMAHHPCAAYPSERVERLIGAGKTPGEIARLRIAPVDRVWCLTRPGILPPYALVEWAIRCAMAVYAEPSWARWAVRWLDGSDRSAASAARAARAARADWAARAAREDWAARAAARAARAARAASAASAARAAA